MLAAKPLCLLFLSLLWVSPSSLYAQEQPGHLTPYPLVGAVVQTWHYDPQANTVTMRIVNTSHKAITAFNVSIVETFADGSVSKHEVMVDSLARVALVQMVKGTIDEDRIRSSFGDGTLAAGQSQDQVLHYPPGKVVTDFESSIDAVAYADNTAEATNTGALARIKEHRNAELHSRQKANEILKSVLADATIRNPGEQASTQLEHFLTVWRAQPNYKELDIDLGTIEAIARDLKRAPSVAAAQRLSEADFLHQYIAQADQHISLISRNAQLKTGVTQ